MRVETELEKVSMEEERWRQRNDFGVWIVVEEEVQTSGDELLPRSRVVVGLT